MRKIFLLSAILICTLFIVGSFTSTVSTEVKLYFVDASMQRLIPSDFTVKTKNTDKAAKAVIAELVKGRSGNDKIIQLIPNVKNGLTVKVKSSTAYVNMSEEFVRLHSDAKPHELLTIYSIVNSLTSIKGIVNVKFTVNNKIQKDFKGFCDMRETFIPDYYI